MTHLKVKTSVDCAPLLHGHIINALEKTFILTDSAPIRSSDMLINVTVHTCRCTARMACNLISHIYYVAQAYEAGRLSGAVSPETKADIGGTVEVIQTLRKREQLITRADAQACVLCVKQSV